MRSYSILVAAIVVLLAGCSSAPARPLFIQKNYTGMAHEVFLGLNSSPERTMSQVYLDPEFAQLNESKTLFVGIQNTQDQPVNGTIAVKLTSCLTDEQPTFEENANFTFPILNVALYPEEITVINFTISFIKQGTPSKCDYLMSMLIENGTFAQTGFQVYNQI